MALNAEAAQRRPVADVTVATILVDPSESHHFGVVDIEPRQAVSSVSRRKPQHTDLRSPL